MKKLILTSVLAFVAVGFVACDSLPESLTYYTTNKLVKEWQMPKKSSKSNEAKIKTPHLVLGVDEYPGVMTKGSLGVEFKEKDSKTTITDIKLYPRKCGVIMRIPKDFDKLSDRQKRIVGSKEQQVSLRWFSNNDEDIAEWSELEADLKALWETYNLTRGVHSIDCEPKDIDKVELITSDGTFTYEFK